MYRPRFIDDELINFLSEQSSSTINNLFVAVPRILEQFPHLNERQAQEVLRYWLHAGEAVAQNYSAIKALVVE